MSIVAFKGEVMLAGWSESHNGGAKVTFFLQSAEDLAPFRSMTVAKGKTAGQRFMAVLVEIGDDERPVDQGHKGGAISKLAGRWCGDERFRGWLKTNFGQTWERAEALTLGAPDECVAAEAVRIICGVKSRAELDHNSAAATLFHERVRIPYSKFLEEHHG